MEAPPATLRDSRIFTGAAGVHACFVIGVVSAHTEAPREFSEHEVDLLVSTASLVAGAIENARLYEATRRRAAVRDCRPTW